MRPMPLHDSRHLVGELCRGKRDINQCPAPLRADELGRFQKAQVIRDGGRGDFQKGD